MSDQGRKKITGSSAAYRKTRRRRPFLVHRDSMGSKRNIFRSEVSELDDSIDSEKAITPRGLRARKYAQMVAERAEEASRRSEEAYKENIEKRLLAERELRKKYGTPSKTKFTRVKRIMKTGKAREIKMYHFGENIRRIFKSFYKRSGTALGEASFMYRDEKFGGKAYVLESLNWGDLMLSRLMPVVVGSEVHYQREAMGPTYTKLFEELDEEVDKLVKLGFSLEESRKKVADCIWNISSEVSIDSTGLSAVGFDAIITSGLIVSIDKIRAPKARKYIRDWLKNPDKSFVEKEREYVGSGKGSVIKESGMGDAVRISLGAKGLRQFGPHYGMDGYETMGESISDIEEEESVDAKKTLFPTQKPSHEFSRGLKRAAKDLGRKVTKKRVRVDVINPNASSGKKERSSKRGLGIGKGKRI